MSKRKKEREKEIKEGGWLVLNLVPVGLAVWPWARYSISLNLIFLISKGLVCVKDWCDDGDMHTAWPTVYTHYLAATAFIKTNKK